MAWRSCGARTAEACEVGLAKPLVTTHKSPPTVSVLCRMSAILIAIVVPAIPNETDGNES